MNWIRVVLAVCAAYGYVMEQLDPDTEFLNSDLVKLVFINAPFGVKNAKSRLCKLTKAIYGLKLAASIVRRIFAVYSCRTGSRAVVHNNVSCEASSEWSFVYVCLYLC